MEKELREKIKIKVKEIIKLRKTIQQLIAETGVSIHPSYREPNPYYGVISVDSPLCIEFYYGTIDYLYSPIGKLKISNFLGYTNLDQRKAFKEIVKSLGFIEFEPSIKNNIGVFGPWYTYGGEDYEDMTIDYNTSKEIYNECINELVKEGFTLEL